MHHLGQVSFSGLEGRFTWYKYGYYGQLYHKKMLINLASSFKPRSL